MCDACNVDHGPHFHPDTSIGIFLCCASGLAAVAERVGQIGAVTADPAETVLAALSDTIGCEDGAVLDHALIITFTLPRPRRSGRAVAGTDRRRGRGRDGAPAVRGAVHLHPSSRARGGRMTDQHPCPHIRGSGTTWYCGVAEDTVWRLTAERDHLAQVLYDFEEWLDDAHDVLAPLSMRATDPTEAEVFAARANQLATARMVLRDLQAEDD